MQAFSLCCVCFILADICVRTKAQGPTWLTSNTQNVDASSTGFCDLTAELDANSGDGTNVYFRIQSQTPEGGGFFVFKNEELFQTELRCVEISIVHSQYSVVVRAIQEDGNGEYADLNITIIFNGIPTPPSCTQDTSLTLDLSNNEACNSVTPLTCTSSDGTAVSYRLDSQSPDGGFTLSETTLTCNQASVVATTYTVTVSAANTGNSQSTNIVFTITVSSSDTDNSEGSEGSGSDSNSNNTNNNTGKIVGGVVGGVVGLAVVGLLAFVIYKVWVSSKTT